MLQGYIHWIEGTGYTRRCFMLSYSPTPLWGDKFVAMHKHKCDAECTKCDIEKTCVSLTKWWKTSVSLNKWLRCRRAETLTEIETCRNLNWNWTATTVWGWMNVNYWWWEFRCAWCVTDAVLLLICDTEPWMIQWPYWCDQVWNLSEWW